MYERFYGLSEKPFSLLPDPAFLHLGRQHGTAYSLLEYGVLNQAGFTVVTGDVGCGKTTLIRHLLNQLTDNVTVGLLNNTHKHFDCLLQWVLMAFGQSYASKEPVELYDAFTEFLISEYARRHRVVLIVDEAQNLDVPTLEELRMLSNINADKDLVLQLILVGQPELKATLERPDLRQLAQRVVTHYHLKPLSQEETMEYIYYRLVRAGGSAELFSREACLQVYRHSGGVPRLINLLCDTALTYGFAEDARQISADLVQSVVEERAAGMGVGDRNPPSGMTQQASPPPAYSVATPPAPPTPTPTPTPNPHSPPQANTVEKPQEEVGVPKPQKTAAPKKQQSPADFDRSDARQLFSHLLK